MRPIETLLLLANLLAFFALVVPQLRAMGWTGYSAPIALLITGKQVLVEGLRWQMIPAYTLAVLFLLIWLLQAIAPTGRPTGQKWIKRLATLLGVGLGVLGLAVSISLPMLIPIFLFPQPAGPYQIGMLTYYWVDTVRPDVFSTDPNAHRG